MSDDHGDTRDQPPAQAAEPPASDRWGDPIGDDRKAELRTLFERQAQWAAQPEAERGDSHFDGESITGADVFWLAVLALAASKQGGDLFAAEAQVRAASGNVLRRLLLVLSGSHLEGANLRGAHLEEASLTGAHLEWADLYSAHLKGAILTGAHLKGANLCDAYLEGVRLNGAHLEGVRLNGAHLEGADLREAHLEGANLYDAHLKGADLSGAHLEGAILSEAHLEGAYLRDAHLEGATLGAAHLEGATLSDAHLEGKTYPAADSDFQRIRQWAPDFPEMLPPADLRGAVFDAATTLKDAALVDGAHGGVRVADVRWGGVNLAVIPDWTPFTEQRVLLGDEREAWERKQTPFSETETQRKWSRRQRAEARKEHDATQARARLAAFQAAVRANRQLATALRTQGMNEEADHFAYRAQVVQRAVFRLQGKRGRWAFSGFLDGIAGYGYQPQRSVVTYLVVLALFTGLYMLASYGWLTFGLPPTHVAQLQWYEALVLSVSSFHGRGFFQPLQSPGDPVVILAAMEAVCGLIIEISFIATFTQRFFGR